MLSTQRSWPGRQPVGSMRASCGGYALALACMTWASAVRSDRRLKHATAKATHKCKPLSAPRTLQVQVVVLQEPVGRLPHQLVLRAARRGAGTSGAVRRGHVGQSYGQQLAQALARSLGPLLGWRAAGRCRSA
jgi:hypothetical protein